MNYKLVCIDMDGTLLNRQHKITETSKEMLKKAHELGVHIVISTGRMYVDAEDYSNLIGVKSPVIASNGAIIKEKGSNEVIYKKVLGEELAFKLLNLCMKYKVSPMFSTPETAYGGSLAVKCFVEYLKFKGIFNKNVIFKYVSSRQQWNKIIKAEKDNIIKCEIRSNNRIKLDKVVEELKKIKEIEVVNSLTNNIEITCNGVSKGRAVEVLAAHYNIKREEIIAIGDSENDLSMIEFAGMGIAMGNAIDAVKEKAKYITESNDNEGVAKAINKFILGNS